MGQPVEWAYQLAVAPKVGGRLVTLHRVQHGTDTRFLWLSTSLPEPLQVLDQDQALQDLYTACLALMELSC